MIFNKFIHKYYKIVIFLLLLLLLFFSYRKLISAIPYREDTASPVLQAQDMLQGNLLLHDWALPPDTFWTSNIPFYLIGIVIKGSTPSLMINMPALFYSLVIIASLLMVYIEKNKSSRSSLFYSLFIAFAILSTPSILLLKIISPAAHLLTILYVLISLFALKYITLEKRGILPAFIFFLFLALSAIGDPFALYVLIPPIILVFLYRLIAVTKKKFSLFVIILSLVALLAAKATIFLVNHFNGFYFSSYPAKISFVSFNDFPKNISMGIQQLLSLFGGNFFGLPLMSLDSLEAILHLSILLFLLAVFFLSLKRWKDINLISQIAVLTIVIDFLAYFFSNQPYSDPLAARYFLPVLIYGGIITGINWRIISQNKIIIRGIVIVGIILLFMTLPKFYLPVFQPPTYSLEQWLIRNHYRYGYSDWLGGATVITVDTLNQVKVRPIIGLYDKLIPFEWLSSKAWYRDEGEAREANFIIFNNKKESSITQNIVVNTIGLPDKTNVIDDYTVLTWDKDITRYFKQ